MSMRIGNDVFSNGITFTSVLDPTTNTYRVTGTLSWAPGSHHNQMTLFCDVTHDTLTRPQTVNLPLTVLSKRFSSHFIVDILCLLSTIFKRLNAIYVKFHLFKPWGLNHNVRSVLIYNHKWSKSDIQLLSSLHLFFFLSNFFAFPLHYSAHIPISYSTSQTSTINWSNSCCVWKRREMDVRLSWCISWTNNEHASGWKFHHTRVCHIIRLQCSNQALHDDWYPYMDTYKQ